MKRQGDMVPVLVDHPSGPLVVWFTPEEYAEIWAGVDREAEAKLRER